MAAGVTPEIRAAAPIVRGRAASSFLPYFRFTTRQPTVSKNWVTQYNFPAVQQGLFKKELVDLSRPSWWIPSWWIRCA